MIAQLSVLRCQQAYSFLLVNSQCYNMTCKYRVQHAVGWECHCFTGITASPVL